MRILSFVFAFTFSFFAQSNLAQNGVSDPNEVLSSLDTYLGAPTFEDSFAEGQSLISKSESCISARICDIMTTTVEVTRGLDENQNPTATLSYYGSNGKKFQDSVITLERWQRNHGNLLRLHIEKILSFGQPVEIISSSFIEREVTVNEGIEVIHAMRIHLYSGQNRNVEYFFEVTPDLPGTMQVIYSTQRNKLISKGGDTRWIDKVSL